MYYQTRQRPLIVAKLRKEGWKMSRQERQELMAKLDAIMSHPGNHCYHIRSSRKTRRTYGIDRYPVVRILGSVRMVVRHNEYGHLILDNV